MKDIEVIKDFKEWVIPTKWSDVTLKQYQEIEKEYGDDRTPNIINIIHILANKTVDEVNELPAEFLDKILEKLIFISKAPEVDKPSNKIEINGEEYIANVMEKLKVGEYVAVDTVIKQDVHNYAAILAIICRKKGEIYDSAFENEVLPDRIELFEQQPITKILSIVAFFLNLCIMLRTPFQLYSEIAEGIDHIQQSIDNSQKIGLFKRLYLNWQMRKLRKSLKSIKCI